MHPLSGTRLTGFGTLTTPSEDGIRLPQFRRASPSTALDKKRIKSIQEVGPAVKGLNQTLPTPFPHPNQKRNQKNN
jgi:hypothetical protein